MNFLSIDKEITIYSILCSLTLVCCCRRVEKVSCAQNSRRSWSAFRCQEEGKHGYLFHWKKGLQRLYLPGNIYIVDMNIS